MGRTQLALASVAVAAAACLAVLAALREAPAPEPERAPAVATAPPIAPVRELADARASTESPAQVLAENARAADAAEEAFRAALLAAVRDESLPLAAKLDRYREGLGAARGRIPEAPIWQYPNMLAELFLREPSVQRELASRSPAARAGELAHIRRELGFDEDAIERMAARDERREARWQNGLAYMRERARVSSTFAGDALEGELRALREEYFAHEAVTMEREEAEGFFRFERPRIYGRN